MKLRVSFTSFWDILDPNVKSIVISIGGLLLATLALALGKRFFPGFDYTTTTAMVATAFSGFVAHLIKEFVKVK